jgi:hypothetical protein
MTTARWLTQFHEEPTPFGKALSDSARQEGREAAEERRQEAERAAAREARQEAFEFAHGQFGNPMEGLRQAQRSVMDAGEQVADLEAQLERARGKLTRSRSNLEFYAGRVNQATELVTRSQAPSDPLERATYEGHRLFREATRAMWADTTAPWPAGAPRPFAGGATAVRNEPVTCPHCLALPDVTPEELPAVSFAIHHSDADGNPLTAEPGRPVPVPDDAEQRTARHGREITRNVEGPVMVG